MRTKHPRVHVCFVDDDVAVDVCVCVCVCVCLSQWVGGWVGGGGRERKEWRGGCMCVCVCMCLCTSIYTYKHTHTLFMYVCVCVCVCIRTAAAQRILPTVCVWVGWIDVAYLDWRGGCVPSLVYLLVEQKGCRRRRPVCCVCVCGGVCGCVCM
jgi:hypothetical protein